MCTVNCSHSLKPYLFWERVQSLENALIRRQSNISLVLTFTRINWRTALAKIGFCGDKLSQARENVVQFPGFKASFEVSFSQMRKSCEIESSRKMKFSNREINHLMRKQLPKALIYLLSSRKIYP